MGRPLGVTDYQWRRMNRDRELYEDWKELTGKENRSKTPVIEFLQKKYGLYSAVTVYRIIRRLQNEEQEKGGEG